MASSTIQKHESKQGNLLSFHFHRYPLSEESKQEILKKVTEAFGNLK